jgi:hypothetical protein
MLDINTPQNYTGPTTTANSATEGRLKVGVETKKKIIRKYLKKHKNF